MIRLTDNDKLVLGYFSLGLSRSEIAARKGVTREAISQTVRRLRSLGCDVPEPAPKAAPQMDRARKLFAQGIDAKEVAKRLGVTHGRGCNLRRQWLSEGARG